MMIIIFLALKLRLGSSFADATKKRNEPKEKNANAVTIK